MCKIIKNHTKMFKNEIWNAKRGNNVWVPSSVDINIIFLLFFKLLLLLIFTFIFGLSYVKGETLFKIWHKVWHGTYLSIFSKNIYRIHDHPPYRHAIGTEKRAIFIVFKQLDTSIIFITCQREKKVMKWEIFMKWLGKCFAIMFRI